MKPDTAPSLWATAIRPRIPLLVPFAVIAVALFVYMTNPLPLQTAQHLVFDQFQRWHPRAAVPDPVQIIDIDDESLQKLGQWPWPRTRIAELTNKLQKSGVTAIGFDMVFSEPDRTSPAAMAQLWSLPSDLQQLMASLPDHDLAFANAVQRGSVVLGFALNRQTQTQPLQGKPKAKAKFIAVDAPVLPFVPAFVGSVTSLPALETFAAGSGALSFVPDADGVVRRVPMLVRQGDALLPGLTLEVLRVAQRAHNITTLASAAAGVESIRVGAITVGTTESAEVWVHYARPALTRYVPAWKVLAGLVPASELQGRMVMVGTSAQGLMDMRFNALGAVIPGVEIHAQVLDQIVHGGGLSRPGWTSALEVLFTVLAGISAGLIAIRFNAMRAVVAAGMLLAGLCAGSWLSFLYGGVLLDPTMPAVTLLLAFMASSVIRHVRVERRQRWVRQAFSRYVSPNLVDYLVAHPETLRLSGERQLCSFLFTDLEGFTHTMESMDPAEAVNMVNEYLDGMISIAFAHQGTLTRIVGDGLAIIFSAPVVQPDHPKRAVQCALEMQQFALVFAAKIRAQRGIAFGRTRMAVHTGDVIVGNFGGSTLFDYRALGDPVNTAARLESANRYLGTSVCISEAVANACTDVACRPIGQLMLVGKSVPVMVFEPLAAGEPADALYQMAYGQMKRGAPEALAAFEALAQSRPSDTLVAMHLARLQSGQTGDLMVLQAK